MRSENLTGDRGWFIEKDSDESEISYGQKISCDSAAFRAILNFFGRSTRNCHITQRRTVKRILI